MSLLYRHAKGGADWVSCSLATAALACVSLTAWASEPPYSHVPPGGDDVISASSDGASDG